MRYVDHIEQNGTALFQRVCEMDLEGIVAKHRIWVAVILGIKILGKPFQVVEVLLRYLTCPNRSQASAGSISYCGGIVAVGGAFVGGDEGDPARAANAPTIAPPAITPSSTFLRR
jgi:hypothetical protein